MRLLLASSVVGRLLGALLLSAFSAPSFAAQQSLPPGIPVIGSDPVAAFTLVGAGASAEVETIDVTGQPFRQALRVRVMQRPAQIWNVQLNTRTNRPVRKGDVLLATFYVRAVSPVDGSAQTNFVFERASAPYDKSADRTFTPTREWQKIQVRFAADDNFAPSAAQVNFRAGEAVQTLEFGGIEVVDFGDSVRLQDLPYTHATYPGREPDAAWRKLAAANIERFRKGALTVIVTNAQGTPISGAMVDVQMRRHAFGFGTAVAAASLLGSDDNSRRIQERLPALFNKVVLENDMKWQGWEQSPEPALKGAAWLRDHQLPLRGHNLVWPSWHNLPTSLKTEYDRRKSAEGDVAAASWLDRAVADHISQELSGMKGQCVEWDVVNEPYDNHDLQDILGPQALTNWYKLAHRIDPDAVLYLNDYDTFGEGGTLFHSDAFYQTLTKLQSQGAPLGGIGMQSHFGSLFPAPDRILGILDRFAALKLPIEITEFDITNDDEALQADYTRDFLTTVFSHPAVSGFLMWGFWDGAHWLNNAPLYHRDWTLKPSGKAWIDLVQHQWWTSVQGDTDRRGIYTTRGFLGEYEITVSAPGGKKVTVPATLTRSGTQVTVTVPATLTRSGTQ